MKKPLIPIIALCLLAALAAGVLCCGENLRLRIEESIAYPECPAEPLSGKWYSLSTDASRWKGRIRFGNSDQLLIYFLGGGVVLDDYSQTQSHSAVGGKAFYYDHDLNVSARRIKTGIASDEANNPFRDWTILVLPYTTGDFHVGAGGIHQGYTHFRALMDKAMPHLTQPERLLIAGYSAGGFGASMLVEDVLSYFPETQNVTLCVDGALLLSDRWSAILRERWQAPEHISSRIQSDNLTLDHLIALRNSRPDVKLLFTSSARDGGLAKFQSYMDGGEYKTTSEGGSRYFENLSEMLALMSEQLPEAGVYLWDDAGSGLPTGHTILYSGDFFTPMSDGTSVCDWILDAVNGKVGSRGLDLLRSLQ